MKQRYTAIYSLLIILLIGFSACSRTEDSLFDESAAIRLSQSISEITDFMQSAENGWIFEYFPNDESAGVVYIVDFTSAKEATMASINPYMPTYKEAQGYWRVISDMGPVLTFDTYNEIFHIFSDPIDPESGSSDGVGLGGDYEFLVVAVTDDEIILKGKKNGNISSLRKLAIGQDWEAYLNELKVMSQNIFGQNIVPLQLVVNNELLMTLKNGGKSHIFTTIPAGGNEIDDADAMPFLVTDNGIRLTNPLIVGDKSIRSFKLADDGNSLIGIDEGVDAIIQAIAPEELLMAIVEQKKYMMLTNDSSSMSIPILDAYNLLDQAVVGRDRKTDHIGFMIEKNLGFSLAISTSKGASKAEGHIGFDYDIVDNRVQLSRNDNINTNGANLINNFEAGSIIALLEGIYQVSALGANLASTTLKFVDINDTNKWFTLTMP